MTGRTLFTLASAIVLGSATLAAPSKTLTARAPSGTKNVIIQMFEWTWASVGYECTQYIGPAGYGYVQVSPPQEHVQGSQWWTDYQPVSYKIQSKRGNRSEFESMVSTCHAAGVGVIADTIWNHMSGGSGTGVAGSSYTHYNYPGIYQTQDFHHCGLEPGDDIANYHSRAEVQTCELVNLADLATETEYVRSRLAQYGNDLLSLGVDGFRLDASKHIAATDISNILGRLDKKPYITQEVIWGAGEPIQPSEYVRNGDVQEFRYTSAIKDAFLSSGISGFTNVADRGWIASGSANIFVSNHDTERNGDSLNYKSPSNTYTLAHVFSLAWPFGTATVLSSYIFGENDDGPPNGGNGTCYGPGGVNGWLCQHRWPPIAGLVALRNQVYGSPVTNFVSDSSQQIAFGRGSLGFVVINNADSTWSKTFTTSLPNGAYCDVASGVLIGSICTSTTYTVSDGKFLGIVAPRTAIALRTGAMHEVNHK